MTPEEAAAIINERSNLHKLAEYRSRGSYLHALDDAALVTRWVSATRTLGTVLEKIGVAIDAGTPQPDAEYLEALESVFDTEAEALERNLALPIEEVQDVLELAVEVYRKLSDHDALAEITAASLDAPPIKLVLQ